MRGYRIALLLCGWVLWRAWDATPLVWEPLGAWETAAQCSTEREVAYRQLGKVPPPAAGYAIELVSASGVPRYVRMDCFPDTIDPRAPRR